METKQMIDLAQNTWLLALEFAEKNGVTFVSSKGAGHAVNVKGGTTRFIRQAAKEYNLKVGKMERDAVRKFLGETGNIFTLDRLEGPVNYRIFVRGDWNDERSLEEPAERTRYRIKETGQSPGGESGPVETHRISDEFETDPLGPAQAENLKVLYTHGGKIENPAGFACTDQGMDASTISRLGERGLVSTRKKNKRRFLKIELTSKGWWVAERLSFMQTSEVAVAFFLSRVGSFEGSTPRQTMIELGGRTYKTHSGALSAIQTLMAQGLVSATRTSDGDSASYRCVTWEGGEVPGVHLSPAGQEKPKIEEQFITKTEPEPKTETKTETKPTNGKVDRIDRIVKIVEELEQFFGGADQEEFDALKAQVHMVRKTCKRFSEGEISALRALANIDDVLNQRP